MRLKFRESANVNFYLISLRFRFGQLLSQLLARRLRLLQVDGQLSARFDRRKVERRIFGFVVSVDFVFGVDFDVIVEAFPTVAGRLVAVVVRGEFSRGL